MGVRVTWAPPSKLAERTMHVRECESCSKRYLQVAEDAECPSCKGVTWPVGVFAQRWFAGPSGSPAFVG